MNNTSSTQLTFASISKKTMMLSENPPWSQFHRYYAKVLDFVSVIRADANAEQSDAGAELMQSRMPVVFCRM